MENATNRRALAVGRDSGTREAGLSCTIMRIRSSNAVLLSGGSNTLLENLTPKHTLYVEGRSCRHLLEYVYLLREHDYNGKHLSLSFSHEPHLYLNLIWTSIITLHRPHNDNYPEGNREYVFLGSALLLRMPVLIGRTNPPSISTHYSR